MIDWDHHFRRMETAIAHARRRAMRGIFADLPARERRESEARWIRTLAAMLASRHISAETRATTPVIPGRAMARLAAYVERCRGLSSTISPRTRRRRWCRRCARSSGG